jgi:hypothetical protein
MWQTMSQGSDDLYAAIRSFALCIAIILFAGGCLSRPIEPDDLKIDWGGKGSQLHGQALHAFQAIFGSPLPQALIPEEQVTGWRDHQGNLKQIRAEVELPDEDFNRRFRAKEWRRVQPTKGYLEAMHLSRTAAREMLSCYLGKVNGKPAYVMRFKGSKTMMLVVDM